MAKQSSETRKMLKVKWPLEDEIPFLYANHFGLMVTEHEAVLIFGNFLPTGLAERTPNEINNYLSKTTIKPLAKIVLSKEGFRAFAELINKKIEAEGDVQDSSIETLDREEKTTHD